MRRILIIERRAIDDLHAHFVYLLERSPQAAAKWLVGITKAMQTLESDADWHPVVPESDIVGRTIQQMLFGRGKIRLRILYTIRDREVHVLHVRHGMRRPLDETDAL